MRIGIVSDTHNNMRNVARIVELFNEARVDRVIHTGDITKASTLDVFRHLTAPMYGVFGNNDQELDTLLPAIERNGFVFRKPPFELQWHGRQIIVVHDPLEFEGHLTRAHDVALHGHTHLYRREVLDGSLVFNPGECAGHMTGFNAIGVLDLTTLETELLKF